MKLQKRLIVCADDFGLSKGVNHGIIRCYQNGILKSASLMANGPQFSHALNLAKENPGLDIGIHLTLTDVRPICPHKIKSLINQNDNFFTSYKTVVNKIVVKPSILGQIESEFRSQIEHILKTGIVPSHLNSHKHIHIFPPVWKIVIKLSMLYKIPFVRNPIETFVMLMPEFITSPGEKLKMHLISHFILLIGLKLFSRLNKLITNSGVNKTDYFCGLFETGKLDVKLIIDRIKKLKPGATELMCHPGYIDEDLLGFPTRLLKSREKEVEALCSLKVKQAITENRVELISFRDQY